jgi:RecB family endonuclease NucS
VGDLKISAHHLEPEQMACHLDHLIGPAQVHHHRDLLQEMVVLQDLRQEAVVHQDQDQDPVRHMVPSPVNQVAVMDQDIVVRLVRAQGHPAELVDHRTEGSLKVVNIRVAQFPQERSHQFLKVNRKELTLELVEEVLENLSHLWRLQKGKLIL